MNHRKHLFVGGAFVLPFLLSVPALGAPLERQPYLQSSSDTQITVVWKTTVADTGEVRYGINPANLDQSVMAAGSATQHAVMLTGLSPDTRYYYAVVSGGVVEAGEDVDHTFVTHPVPGTDKKFRAWIVGDSGTGGSMQAQVRDAMANHVGVYRPDLYLHVGDMAYGSGTEAEFTSNFYAPYESILRGITVWPALGNHEGASSDSQTQSGPYYDGYVLPTGASAGGLPSGTEAYYSFDYANAHFVVLDSHDSDRSPGGAMLTWAQNDIAATAREWVIAYWHHPPYTRGSHDSDFEGRLIDMREDALPILEAAGVDLVLAGHSHIYERSYLLNGSYGTPSLPGIGVLDSGDGRPDGDGPYEKGAGKTANQGTVYVVAGHGGTGVSGLGNHPMMVFDEVENGSCVLDIQQNRLSMINIRADGEITDRVSMIKGDGIIISQPDGGEILPVGQPYEIKWTTVGLITSVVIEYSLDDGQNWMPLLASGENDGSHVWMVPAVDTNTGLIRISDEDEPLVFDESNAGFKIQASVPEVIIPFGGAWKYHDQGVDLGETWVEAGYDDGAWPSGNGQLGYGDGDETTVLMDADPNYPSAYFRTTFELTDEVLEAQVSALYDDGVAVWVNGTQVHAVNVADTSYGAFASGTAPDNSITVAPVNPALFVQGTNTIAAMAKQASDVSSDLSFDLELQITPKVDPPDPTGGTSAGTSGGTTDPTTAGSDSDSASSGGAGSEVTSATASGSATDGGTDSAGQDGAGGCGCKTNENGGPAGAAAFMLVLGFMRRRVGAGLPPATGR